MEKQPALAATSPSSEQASEKSNHADTKKTKVIRLLMAYTFLFASFKDGFGPLVSVYLVVSKGWSPGKAGIIWFTRDASTLLCSSFVGAIVDRSKRKRLLLLGTTVVSSLAAASIAWTQNFVILILTAIVAGTVTSFIPPAKTAMVLGLVSQSQFDAAARDVEVSDHLGSLVIIVIAGVIGYFSYPDSLENIFYIIGVGGLLSCLVLLIMPLSGPKDVGGALVQEKGQDVVEHEDEENPGSAGDCRQNSLTRAMASMWQYIQNLADESQVDHATSRNLGASGEAAAFQSVLQNRHLLTYAASVFAFHLGNAAVLPLVSQVMASETGSAGIPLACGNIAVAQLTSIFAAWAMGASIKGGHGYKASVITGYIVGLPLRCAVIILLIVYHPNTYALLSTQLLDGVGVGTFGLSLPIYVKYLTEGTGHFAFSFGLVHSVWMTAAALSNLLGGYIVTYTNYPVGFAFCGVCGLVSVALLSFVTVNPAGGGDEAEVAGSEATSDVTKDDVLCVTVREL